MGKGGWFAAVKKALTPESKKHQRSEKSKRKWFGKRKATNKIPLSPETAAVAPPAAVSPATENVKLAEAENEQNKHAYSVALATAVAAKAAVAAAQAAAEVIRLASAVHYSGKSREEAAAIKIQTAFRGYMARRALRALRGLVRLKSRIGGHSVKQQATSTLQCMQTLARVQSQIQARRIRMSEENEALQQQLQQKQEKELEKLRASVAEDFDVSTQSKEQIEARQQSKQEAALRRERALAYAFSHQQSWKKSLKSSNSTYMDPNNPRWGWSWLERWMAARPWENHSVTNMNDRGSVKSMVSHSTSLAEISRSYSRRDDRKKYSATPPKSSRPGSRQSPSTPACKVPSISSVTSKTKPPSTKGSHWGGEDDSVSGSIFSVQSERYRRHSIAGSSVRDDESLSSWSSVPSYMAPTQSAKARYHLPSPLGLEKSGSPNKGSAVSARERLSFTGSPGLNGRHSGPPKVDITPVKDVAVHLHQKLGNAGST